MILAIRACYGVLISRRNFGKHVQMAIITEKQYQLHTSLLLEKFFSK